MGRTAGGSIISWGRAWTQRPFRMPNGVEAFDRIRAAVRLWLRIQTNASASGSIRNGLCTHGHDTKDDRAVGGINPVGEHRPLNRREASASSMPVHPKSQHSGFEKLEGHGSDPAVQSWQTRFRGAGDKRRQRKEAGRVSTYPSSWGCSRQAPTACWESWWSSRPGASGNDASPKSK